MTISASWFADFYNDTFEPEDPTEPYLLLQGFPARSLAAGRGLWKLSRMIKATPALRWFLIPVASSATAPLFLESTASRVWLGRLWGHPFSRTACC